MSVDPVNPTKPVDPTTPLPYDFASAYDFESKLKQAFQKLEDLIALRGRLALNDIGYQSGGQRLGWVGKACNDWAGQFNRSQILLNGLLSELNWWINNVNNKLYDKEQEVFKQTSRIKKPPPPVPSIPYGALTNSVTDVEGATPSYLYDYSDQTTSRNDQIRPFFWNTLTGAASASPTEDSPPAYSASDLARDISNTLRKQILPLDARVRIVGEAFALADTKLFGQPTPLDPQKFQTKTKQQLEDDINYEAQQIEAATQLANCTVNGEDPLGNYNIDDYVMQQLQLHENDPAYVDAFLRNLPGKDLIQFLQIANDPNNEADQSGDIVAQVLATEFEREPDDFTRNLASLICTNGWGSGHGLGSEQQFITALSGDHAAARGFLSSLDKDGWRYFATGHFYDDIPGFGGPEEFMEVAASAMKACSPSEARALYRNIAGPDGVLSLMHPGSPDAVAPYIADFIATYASSQLGPPSPGQDLTDWATKIGVVLHDSLYPFRQWIPDVDEANSASASSAQSAIIGLVITGLTSSFTGPVGLGIAIGTDLLEGPIQQALQTNFLPPGGEPVSDSDLLRLSVRAGAEVYVAGQLAKQGRLYIDGRPATQTDIDQLLATVAQYAPKGPDATDSVLESHLKQWTIDGPGGLELYDKLADAAAQLT